MNILNVDLPLEHCCYEHLHWQEDFVHLLGRKIVLIRLWWAEESAYKRGKRAD